MPINNHLQIGKNLPASRAHSQRALCAQLTSLASLSAPRARDLIVALVLVLFAYI